MYLVIRAHSSIYDKSVGSVGVYTNIVFITSFKTLKGSISGYELLSIIHI